MRDSRLGIIAALCLALVPFAGTASGDEKASANAVRRTPDMVCGPRCLQFLMKGFHPEATTDLLEIVAKVQPEFEKGSSLAHLEHYLNDNGLHTLAIEPPANVAILWPHPVLLYLNVEGEELGHYVVLLPGSDRATATIWSGLTGQIRMPTWQLAEKIGGAALLISPDPIKDVPAAFPATMDARARKVGWMAILIALPIAGFSWTSSSLARRRRANPIGPPAFVDKPPVPAAIGNLEPPSEIDSHDEVD